MTGTTIVAFLGKFLNCARLRERGVGAEGLEPPASSL